MATMGGHGFGAKVALATAINNMDRCTGVINLEGGPLDHRFYEAYHELKDFVNIANKLNLTGMEHGNAARYLRENISCQKWANIFVQNLENKGTSVNWKLNISDLATNMEKY